MNRLPRFNIKSPVGYKGSDFLSIIKKRMPKDSMDVEKDMIIMRLYNLGVFQKNDRIFSAWGMRMGREISIYIEEIKPI